MESTANAAVTSQLALLLLSRCPTGLLTIGNVVALLVAGFIVTTVALWAHPGGPAWGRFRHYLGGGGAGGGGSARPIPGPRGWPIVGSLLEMGQQAHVRLAALARQHSAQALMAFSLGETRVVLTCLPSVARELLASPAFADRPIKQSAKMLMFHRAIGFAPHGDYWRKLRRIASTHLFSPRRIAALHPSRQFETSCLLQAIDAAMCHVGPDGAVQVRQLLQAASVNNVMKSVFGRRYEFGSTSHEALELQRMIREGFDLLGAFNWSDHLPLLSFFDPQCVSKRCAKLVVEVSEFVQRIIDEHRLSPSSNQDESDFVDVMLSLQSAEGLSDGDLIAILWEMIFRGADTTAILMEWILAELVRNPGAQRQAQQEIDDVVGGQRAVEDGDLSKLSHVQAIVKETLRLHPPGPLLSWARLATDDVDIAGFRVPKGTTAMVNMWAITHDPEVWARPHSFLPERFLESDVDVRGGDLRLAPFGAGRRVCPGRALGLATVQLWTARLLHHYTWAAAPGQHVDVAEVLKLSCEMKHPLRARAQRRVQLAF